MTLKAPGSEKKFHEIHIKRIDLQLLNNKLQILYYQEMQKKNIYNVFELCVIMSHFWPSLVWPDPYVVGTVYSGRGVRHAEGVNGVNF